MAFCIGCGVRVDPNVRYCPVCAGKEAAAKGCPRCGVPLPGPQSRFCVACGAPIAAAAEGTAGPAAVSRPPAPAKPISAAAPPASAATTSRSPSIAARIEAAQKERGAIYQRLGRHLIAACYEGKLPYEKMPEDLARQVQGGIQAIRKGHASLAEAGICPRCLEPALSGDPRKCARCGLLIPVAGQPGTK
jgi:hypothetical protein